MLSMATGVVVVEERGPGAVFIPRVVERSLPGSGRQRDAASCRRGS